MESVSRKDISQLSSFQKVIGIILNFIIVPIKYGLVGFSIFFTLILCMKFFLYIMNYENNFILDFNDVGISLIGFSIAFMVGLTQLLRNKKQNN